MLSIFLSNDNYPLLYGVPPSDDDGDVDEDQGEADEQRLKVAVYGPVDAVVVTLFANKIVSHNSVDPAKLDYFGTKKTDNINKNDNAIWLTKGLPTFGTPTAGWT